MRKILLFIVFALCMIDANAQTVKINGLTYNLDSDGMTATITSGTYGDVMIPATVTYNDNKYNVVGVGYKGFSYANVTSVIVLSKKFKTITADAFEYCSNIKMFYAPTTEMIGKYAFYNCVGLDSVAIQNVKNLDCAAFGYCSKVKRIESKSLTTVGDNAFVGCSSLVSVDLDNVVSVGGDAFMSCTSLKKVFLPNVKTIGSGTFRDDNSIESIYLGQNLERLYDYTFYNCSKVKSFTCCVEIPPITTSTTFAGMDKASCVLYVPEESVEYYKMAVNWKDFKNIKPIKNEATGIMPVKKDMIVDVYSVSGSLIMKNTTIEQAKQRLKGVYIVSNKKIIF